MNGTLPGWVERLLGISGAASGEGTLWSLEHAWPLAPWVSLLAAILAAALVAYLYLREPGPAGRTARLALAMIRLAALAIVALMIAELMLSLRRTGLPYVVVALDDSASMGIVDRYEEEELVKAVARAVGQGDGVDASRLNLARSILLDGNAELLRQIDRRYKLKVYCVSDAARPQEGSLEEIVAGLKSLEPSGQTSRLGSGLRTILNDLRGTPPTALILLSDGVNTEGESLADAVGYARRKGVPIFSVALGSETPLKDLKLSDLLVDEVVFVDDVVSFECKLGGAGYQGKTVTVSLREQGQSKRLAETKVTINDENVPQEVRLQYRPTRVGDFQYVVEVEAQADEVTAENNRQQRLVSVRKEQIRVLLVQAYPSYEFRYLRQMLHRDSTVELKTVLQEADLEYAEFDQTGLRVFPVQREELLQYDVIIFGDVNPAFLSASALNHLSDFVTEKGGGLVFIAGPRYTPLAYGDTPLAPLFPVELGTVELPPQGQNLAEGFLVQPTDLGLASPSMQLGDSVQASRNIWGNLPPLYWLLEAPTLKPAARVLAEHPVRLGADGRRLPVIAMQYVGAGKVIFHASDETWRWRWRVGDVYFARYWVQTLRYLSRAKLVGKDRSAVLSVDRREYRLGESVRLWVRFADERLAPADDDGVTVVLERLGQKDRHVQLRRNVSSRGVFEGVVPRPSEGAYHAWVATPTLEGAAPAVDFEVVAPLGEMQRLQADVAELRRASSETKGKHYDLATAGRLLGELPKGRQVPIESLPPIVLWNRWPLLCGFLVLLVGEWVLRKRKGML